ncbi:MAG: hypothetical protein M1822_005233 [Bathelium mastoideum]|nr:MAG: hypothetical protein M1822_005233 [Bathelium mastoideum]
MYRWYENASVCYVYLDDVSHDDPSAFERSTWFTRSWTLQELIAPRDIIFYDKNWKYIGSRESRRDIISRITKVSTRVLQKDEDVREMSVAQRMSWASSRRATRVEDIAYSLMGLFGVNMPLLYGEGHKAFLRLQEEIIKISDDQSIFAWSGVKEGYPGLLAQSPDAFRTCNDIIRINNRTGGTSFVMTNRGLSVTLEIYQWKILDMYVALLNCMRIKDSEPQHHPSRGYSRMGIFLRRLAEFDQWARVEDDQEDLRDRMDDHMLAWKQANPIFSHGSAAVSEEVRTLTTYQGDRNIPFWEWRGYHMREMAMKVRQMPFFSPRGEDALFCRRQRIHGFRICNELLVEGSHGPLYKDILRRSRLDKKTGILVPNVPSKYPRSIVSILDISKQQRQIKFISLGFDFDFNPVCFLAEAPAVDEKDLLKKRLKELVQEDGKGQEIGANGNSDKDLFDFRTSHAHFDCEKINATRGILERLPTDTVGWNQIEGDGALPHRFRAGLWALKGDYVNGLCVSLRGPKYKVEFKRDVSSGHVIWDFNLERVSTGPLAMHRGSFG